MWSKLFGNTTEIAKDLTLTTLLLSLKSVPDFFFFYNAKNSYDSCLPLMCEWMQRNPVYLKMFSKNKIWRLVILLTQLIILDSEEPLKSSRQVFVVLCCVVLFWTSWTFPPKKSGSRWHEVSCDMGRWARNQAPSPPAPYETPGEPRAPLRVRLNTSEPVRPRRFPHKETKCVETSNQPRVKSSLDRSQEFSYRSSFTDQWTMPSQGGFFWHPGPT